MTWNLNYELGSDFSIILCEGEMLGEEQGPDLIEVVNDIINKDINLAIIDLSKIKYVNSSGIGVLITILTKFRNVGGDIALLQPSEHVNKLLVMTKLSAIFYIAEDIEQAKRKLRNK